MFIQTVILYPMLALVAWTLVVLSMIGFRRVSAASAGRVRPHDFKFGESAAVPPDVSLPNRNYMNLLEAPTLFYVVSITYYITQHADRLALALAWAFVALRVVHSLVHLAYNNVLHRLVVFVLSNLTLGILLILLFVRLSH